MKRVLLVTMAAAALIGCGGNPNAGTSRERPTAGAGDGSRESAINRSADVKSPYPGERENRAGQAIAGDKKNMPVAPSQADGGSAVGTDRALPAPRTHNPAGEERR